MALTIEPVTTIAQCRQIEDLQYRIWGGDPIDVVPDHLLITIAKNRGVVLLALEDGQPVGFCYSFLATTTQGQLKHCSHQTGVLPEAKTPGVGYQLKLAQREAARKQGINLITWTFDPMLALNANLNLGKLGGTSQTYIEKLYGDMRTEINEGLDSDRLEVCWWLNSPRVEAKLAHQWTVPAVQDIPILNDTSGKLPDGPGPIDDAQFLTRPAYWVQIPDHIQQLKSVNLPLAVAWQTQIRTIFQMAFSQGYVVADFIWQRAQQRGLYYLRSEK